MLTCKDCYFWKIIKEDPALAENNGIERGTCHCSPPSVTTLVVPEINSLRQMVPQVIDRTAFPITTSEGWCGQAKAKEEPVVVPERLTETVS